MKGRQKMFDSILGEIEGTMDIGSELICILVALLLGSGHCLGLQQAGNGLPQFPRHARAAPGARAGGHHAGERQPGGRRGGGRGLSAWCGFRSLPGTSREILGIFFAMVAGLATGMGYISYAILFTAIVCGILVLLERLHFGGKTGQHTEGCAS
jgi:hypothetical protein